MALFMPYRVVIIFKEQSYKIQCLVMLQCFGVDHEIILPAVIGEILDPFLYFGGICSLFFSFIVKAQC